MRSTFNFLTKFPFVSYGIFFLLFFIQFPINNSLPGVSDTIFSMASLVDYNHRLDAYLTNSYYGYAQYPTYFYQSFSELYLGQAFIFSIFYRIGFNDVWAYTFLLISIFTLNAWSFYKLLDYLKFSTWIAFAGGIIISCNTFLWGQIEFLNGFPYFCSFFGLIFFFEAIRTQKIKSMIIFSILIGIQFHFSIYISFYTLIVCLAYTILSINDIKNRVLFTKHMFFAAIIFFAIVSPSIWIYYEYGFIQNGVSSIAYEDFGKFSFKLTDLLRPLSDHSYYHEIFPVQSDSFKIVNYAFLGFAFFLLALVSLFYLKGANRKLTFIFLFIGILLIMNPEFKAGKFTFYTPLYPLYKNSILRVSSRAFFLIIIGCTISILHLIQKIKDADISRIFTFCLLVVFLFENIPFKFHNNNAYRTIQPPKALLAFLESLPENKVLAFLPSSLFAGKGYNKDWISEHSREAIYQYWHNSHMKNMVNGLSGYTPKKRIEINQFLDNHNWSKLDEEYHVSYYIYSYSMAIDQKEISLLDSLKHNKQLSISFASKDFIVFKYLK